MFSYHSRQRTAIHGALVSRATICLVLAAYTSWDELPLTLRLKDVADVLGVSTSTAHRLVQRGALRAVRLSARRIVVSKDALRAFLHGQAPNINPGLKLEGTDRVDRSDRDGDDGSRPVAAADVESSG